MIRANWLWIVILIVCIGGALFGVLKGADGTGAGSSGSAAPVSSAAPLVQVLPANAPAPPPAVKRETPAEKAAATIEQHQKRFDASADPVEKAAMLNSMANLYAMKLGDTPKAIELYERVIFEFPEYPGIRGIYPKLAESYGAIGKEEDRRKTYQRMMKAFSEDTQEYQFAASELGLK